MASSTLPEELRYYVVRGGEAIIPMVPVDQLPPWIELEGIPRQLTPRQKSDEGWKSTCDTDHPAVSLQIKNPSPSSSRRQLSRVEVRLPPAPEVSPQFLAPDHLVRSEAEKPSEASRQVNQYTDRPTTAERYLGQLCTSRTATPERTMSSANTPLPTYIQDSLRLGHCSPNPSGLVPNHSKKVYCTHWMRTGSCDFAQIGCKYKHEMPSKAKLLELGIRQTPLWWKEKQAIRIPTWMEERRAATKFSESEPPPPGAHDRMSWINRLSLDHGAQNRDDPHASTPEQRPASGESEILVSNSMGRIRPQSPAFAPRCAFVDDLIDLHDDTDDSTSSDAAMSASSRDTQASSSTGASSPQSSPTHQSIANDAINTKSSPGDAIQGDNKGHPDPAARVSRKQGPEHGNETDAEEASCNDAGTASTAKRLYCKPQQPNGLAASQHATACVESPELIKASGEPTASSVDQPAGKDVQVVGKRSRPCRRNIKPAKKGLGKDTVRGVSK